MSDDKDLMKVEQATTRYSMQDGFVPIFMGLILIVTSGAIWASWLSAYIALFVVFGPQLLETFRERYTYPRIGYVKLRGEESSTRIGAGILGFIVICLIISLISMYLVHGTITAELFYVWAPAWFGMIMIGPSLYLVEKTGSRIYYFFGIMTVITGFTFALLSFDPVLLGFSLYLLGWGLVMTSIGLVTFLSFIRRFPILKSTGAEEVES